MIKLSPIEKAIELSILTPYVENADTVSLLLVANPESGKTEVIRKFVVNKGIKVSSDITAYKIVRNYLGDIEKGNIKHLVIPDMSKIIKRRPSTKNALLGLLNMLTEEGIMGEIQSYVNDFVPKDPNKKIKCGLITSITPMLLKADRFDWNSIGLHTRLLPLSWSYSTSTKMEIFEYLKNGMRFKEEPIIVRTPDNTTRIELPREHANQLQLIAIEVGNQKGCYGFRAYEMLDALAKASALNEGRNIVDSTDMEQIFKIIDYINLDEKLI